MHLVESMICLKNNNFNFTYIHTYMHTLAYISKILLCECIEIENMYEFVYFV